MTQQPVASAALPTPQATAAATAPPIWPSSGQRALAVLLVLTAVFLGSRFLLNHLTARPIVALDKVDLNTATLAELGTLPGIGPQLAKRIVEHREWKGPFEKIEQLTNVPGIGPATLLRLRDRVTVSPMQPREAGQELTPRPVLPRTTPKTKKGVGLTKPIDVNSASVEELQQLPGIGVKLSQRIVEERSKRPFSSIDDLLRVHGIGKKTVEKVRPFAVAGQSEGASPSLSRPASSSVR